MMQMRCCWLMRDERCAVFHESVCLSTLAPDIITPLPPGFTRRHCRHYYGALPLFERRLRAEFCRCHITVAMLMLRFSHDAAADIAVIAVFFTPAR